MPKREKNEPNPNVKPKGSKHGCDCFLDNSHWCKPTEKGKRRIKRYRRKNNLLSSKEPRACPESYHEKVRERRARANDHFDGSAGDVLNRKNAIVRVMRCRLCNYHYAEVYWKGGTALGKLFRF